MTMTTTINKSTRIISRALAFRTGDISTRSIASASRRYSDQSGQPGGGGATKDPSHPYLYYHPSSSQSTILSFLSTTPSPGSSTILGTLPLGGSLEHFREEPKFLKLLHSSIKEGLRLGKGETVEFEAATRPGDGYIHITDERAIPPAGRIGETEDLIGSVFVKDGKVVAETYDAQPTYRLVTSNGPLILPRGLDKFLIERLEAIDKEEKGRA